MAVLLSRTPGSEKLSRRVLVLGLLGVSGTEQHRSHPFRVGRRRRCDVGSALARLGFVCKSDMGCGASAQSAEATYMVGREETAPKVHADGAPVTPAVSPTANKRWPTLSTELLVHIAAAAGVSAWRWGGVCKRWREATRRLPRKVRFDDVRKEELEDEISFVRKLGRSDWKLEAMGNKGAAGVADALRYNLAINTVGVHRSRQRGTPLGLRGAAKLAIAVSMYDVRLKTLDLGSEGAKIGRLGAQKLGRAFFAQAGGDVEGGKGGGSLVELNLRANELGDEGVKEMAPAIGLTRTLQVLNLESNSITEEGAQTLADSMRAPSCRLKNLVVRGNVLGRRGAALLASALRDSLTTLDVVGCGLGPAGAKSLAEALGFSDDPEHMAMASTSSALTSLDLSENRIGDEGASAFGKLLERGCSALSVLALSDNGVGPAGAKDLAAGAGVEGCPLRNLDLSENRVGNDGAIALALALGRMGAGWGLEQLNLVENNVGDKGVEAIGRSLGVRYDYRDGVIYTL